MTSSSPKIKETHLAMAAALNSLEAGEYRKAIEHANAVLRDSDCLERKLAAMAIRSLAEKKSAFLVRETFKALRIGFRRSNSPPNPTASKVVTIKPTE